MPTTDAHGGAPRWKGRRPFVGRADALRFLDRSLEVTLLGGGRVAFIYGPPGSGRTRTLREFGKRAPRRFRGVRCGYGDAADAGRPAWKQLAEAFTGVRRVLNAFRDTAAPWLGLLPLVGGVIEAIIDTWEKLRPKRVGDAARTRLGTGSSVDQVRTLLQHGVANPRVILLDNLDAADADELAGAFAMAQRLEGTRTLVVIAASERAARSAGPVRDLELEVERLGVASSFHLSPLDRQELASAAETALRRPMPAAWADWWAAHMDGTPSTLWSVMARLEASGAISRSWFTRRRWAEEPPDGLAPQVSKTGPEAASDLAAAADEPDAVLLSHAATLGERFRSTELARATGIDELALDDRLAGLVRRGRIELVETAEEDGEFFDVYDFLPPGAAAWRLRDRIATMPSDARIDIDGTRQQH